MEIETVADLADVIANWIGVYDSCPNECKDDSCERSKESDLCCRVRFVALLEDRIRNAVENDKKINEINLTHINKTK